MSSADWPTTNNGEPTEEPLEEQPPPDGSAAEDPLVAEDTEDPDQAPEPEPEHEDVAGPMPGVQPDAGQTSGAVDANVAEQLESLRDRPLSEHPDVYQRIHEDLHGALADIDSA